MKRKDMTADAEIIKTEGISSFSVTDYQAIIANSLARDNQASLKEIKIQIAKQYSCSNKIVTDFRAGIQR